MTRINISTHPALILYALGLHDTLNILDTTDTTIDDAVVWTEVISGFSHKMLIKQINLMKDFI